jgi:hypothetical protein
MKLRIPFRRLRRKQPDSDPQRPGSEAEVCTTVQLDLPPWMPQGFDPESWAEYQARMEQTVQYLLAYDVNEYLQVGESDVQH